MECRSSGARPSVPSLSRHVAIVVGGCAEPEMVGSHADRIVTGMTHIETFRNRPTMQFPRQPMRVHKFTRATSTADDTVPLDQRPSEDPTRAGLLHFLPKPICDWAPAGLSVARLAAELPTLTSNFAGKGVKLFPARAPHRHFLWARGVIARRAAIQRRCLAWIDLEWFRAAMTDARHMWPWWTTDQFYRKG
jgi:hypothetical protein